jgi:hypothetical protein
MRLGARLKPKAAFVGILLEAMADFGFGDGIMKL